MEEFRKIQNYDKYSVSNLGKVRNSDNLILKTRVGNHGYYYVNLCKNGEKKKMTVHRLIANAFIENPDGKPCVDHIDNSRINNNINNLRWVTFTENNRNIGIRNGSSSGIKGVYWNKNANKWHAQIQIDGIKFYLGIYNTIEEATQARVQRARQAFGQYVSACEGVKYDAKPKKIRKPKKVIQPIVKTNVQQMFDDIVTLKNNYKNSLLKLQHELLNM